MKKCAVVLFFYILSRASFCASDISLWMVSGEDTFSKVRTILLSFPIEDELKIVEQKHSDNHQKRINSPEELSAILRKISLEGV